MQFINRKNYSTFSYLSILTHVDIIVYFMKNTIRLGGNNTKIPTKSHLKIYSVNGAVIVSTVDNGLLEPNNRVDNSLALCCLVCYTVFVFNYLIKKIMTQDLEHIKTIRQVQLLATKTGINYIRITFI